MPKPSVSDAALPRFRQLVESIRTVDEQLSTRAVRAVNSSLTLRNWLIGFRIQEYEQRGADRAEYGDRLFKKLATELKQQGVSRSEARELRRYRLFYQMYPQIWETLSPEIRKSLGSSDLRGNQGNRESLTPLSGHDLIGQLSFSHISQLLSVDSDAKRAFYEAECVRGCWSVRELKRQITSLLYERSALSIDKQKLISQTDANAQPDSLQLTIRDPYVFEFLGLKPQEVMSESHLEDQLLDRLQTFLMELGQGFCFEARQRRILIGDTYYFIDLVFYHRILKCHVLVDLKLEAFAHLLRTRSR